MWRDLKLLNTFLSDRSPESVPPTTFILQLMEWTFKNNVFLFQDVFYKQMKGTAMGACFSLPIVPIYFRIVGRKI